VWDGTDLKIILEELSPHICITVGLILLTWFLHLSSRRRMIHLYGFYTPLENTLLNPSMHLWIMEGLFPIHTPTIWKLFVPPSQNPWLPGFFGEQ
jgi:hypothetical protein